MKSFNSLDGHGVKLLGEAGIATAIITGRRSEIVAARAKEMKIAHLFQGVENKLAVFTDLIASLGLTADQCGYMGDDWPDLPVMLRCGFATAPRTRTRGDRPRALGPRPAAAMAPYAKSATRSCARSATTRCSRPPAEPDG